jgi:hypothetical protein
MYERVNFDELLGKTCIKITANDDAVTFDCGDTGYSLFHDQSCCESVTLEDVCGSWDEIIGSPILLAEEVTNTDDPPRSEHDECYLWTFYKLATIKGYVTMRWYGESNGYYGEDVQLHRTR